MGYDIYLVDPVTRQVLKGKEPHHYTGGTYEVGGSTYLTLNVTYNYAKHYYRVFGKNGIRTIYGMTAKESILLLENAICKLDTDVTNDYWESTEGNARKALIDLLAIARLAPHGMWNGD